VRAAPGGDAEERGSRGAAVAWVFAAWTLYALFNAGQTYFALRAGRQPSSLLWSLRAAFVGSYLWAFCTLYIIALTKRFPLDEGRRVLPVLVHLSSVVGIGLLHVYAARLFASVGWYLPSPFWSRFLRVFPVSVLQAILLVGIAHGFTYYVRLRSQELQASRLRASLSEARLQALKMQLQPHFLFNALNAVSTLIHRDPEAADQMLASLAAFLRHTLATAQAQEVPLAEELRFLELYLEIEQVRFGHRLQVAMRVERGTRQALVPHLILQPLVENAIRHGIATLVEGGRVEISAAREGEQLRLRVRDNGVGLAAAGRSARGEGVGLASTRGRLEQLYGAAHHFTLSEPAGGGTLADLSIPFRTEGDAAPRPPEPGGRAGRPAPHLPTAPSPGRA
jgi:signal transduction histidine kinase